MTRFYYVAAFLSLCCQTHATPTPTARFGFSGSLTGHFGSYGIMISRGIQAAFKGHPYTINGIKQYAELICMDDRGKAITTEKNILKMRKDGISSFVGIMGTRGILGILPLVEKKQIAVLFPWGTDAKFQDPKLSNLVNALGLINPQVDALVSTILAERKLSKIAIFHADDSFSESIAKYCTEQLTKSGSAPVLITAYNRYTLDLNTALTALCNADPRVTICISTSMPAVKIINMLFRKGFFGCSFFGIDSTFLVPEILATKGVSFSYSSSVPSPTKSEMPLAKQFCHDLAKFYPDEKPTPLSFAYYICGRLIIEAINLHQDLSSKTIIKAFEAMRDYDFHGFPIDFNPKNRFLFGQRTWLLE